MKKEFFTFGEEKAATTNQLKWMILEGFNSPNFVPQANNFSLSLDSPICLPSNSQALTLQKSKQEVSAVF